MPYFFNPFSGQVEYYQAATGGGGGGNTLKQNRSVTPAPDGSTTVFTIPDTIIAGSLAVFLNGIDESHFTETTLTTFTMATAPHTGDELFVWYQV